MGISKKRRGGFGSPLEFLIIFGLIALLAIPFFPFAGRARENARRSQCQSNLKLIAMSVRQYAQEHDSYLPLAVSKTGNRGWAYAISPYRGQDYVLQCFVKASGSFNDVPVRKYDTAYWYNSALSWNGKPGGKARWDSLVKTSELRRPALTVMLGDADLPEGEGTSSIRSNGFAAAHDGDGSHPSGIIPKNGKVAGQGLVGGGQRHWGGINVAFADGHVKWYVGAGADENESIYNFNTPFSVSKLAPTFNAIVE
ncbi:DUF1559 domain-containing protein [bacterium]|nr:MAG: DUF1559 domain-containing protein [bacterium]